MNLRKELSSVIKLSLSSLTRQKKSLSFLLILLQVLRAWVSMMTLMLTCYKIMRNTVWPTFWDDWKIDFDFQLHPPSCQHKRVDWKHLNCYRSELMKINCHPQTRDKEVKFRQIILILVYCCPGWNKLLVHYFNYWRQKDICKLSYNKQLNNKKKRDGE